jgi:hypothetical protein
MGEGDPEGADFAALERRRKRSRANGCVVALLEKGMHPLTEFSQLGRTLAPEKIAAKLALQLLDGPRQRWLRHIALVGRAREVKRVCDREEIPDLMHFHDELPLI